MGQHTGRAAKDKYIVEEPETRDDIWWNLVNVSYPEVPGVPKVILNPRLTWADPVDYERQARKLARQFNRNFEQYRDHCPASVIGAGPQAG
jgi:ATP-dependent phosphoenolpyruvate carboxykinase